MKNILILIFLFVASFGFSQNANTPTTGGGAADGTETIITAGTNVTVSGTGASGTPYVIGSSGNVTENTVAGQTPVTNPPAAPAEGDEFLNTTDNLAWIYDGTVWEPYPVTTYRIGKRVELITGLSGDSIRVVCDSLIASDNSFSISCDTLFIARNGRYWYVSNNGNNFDAEKGNISKPCRDMWAAVDSADAGDLVYVFKGVWNAGFTGEEATHGVTEFHKVYDAILNLNSISLWKPGVDIYFDPGATINVYNENNLGRFICMPLFNATTAGKMSIKGFGSFSMIGSLLKSVFRTLPTPSNSVINPGAGIFGAYFIWTNHDEAIIDFNADYINNKDILFENTKVNIFTAKIKNCFQNGRDLITVRGTGVRRSNIVLDVESIVCEFTEQDEIDMFNSTSAVTQAVNSIANTGAFTTYIAGENKQIDIKIKNIDAKIGVKQLLSSAHSVNNKINYELGNYKAVDALDFYTSGVKSITNHAFYYGNTMLLGVSTANLTTSQFKDTQLNYKIGNVEGPFAHAVDLSLGTARNSQINAEFNNCRLTHGNAIRLSTTVTPDIQTNSKTNVKVKGNFICDTRSAVIAGQHNVATLPQGYILPNSHVNIELEGRYETKASASPSVELKGENTRTLIIDGVSTLSVPSGRIVFNNATIVTPFATSTTSVQPYQIISKGVYSNKPLDVNTTSVVQPVVVDLLID